MSTIGSRVLVGRREEMRRIGALLAGVKRGRSGALVLLGEPGIGKSALLDETVRRARGLRVVRTCGVESESELPYAGLLTLTRPIAGLVPSLPEPQALALTAALALGPAKPADPLAVCAATLGPARRGGGARARARGGGRCSVARRRDGAIGRFRGTPPGRRAGGDPVALREGEESAFSPAGLEQLVVRGLALDEASKLLGGRVATSVARRLGELTVGNPLALLELADDLSEGQRAGLDPIAEPLPVAEALQRAFGRQLNRLSESARAAVVVAAAAGNRDDVTTLERAWSRVGAGRDDLADAERSGTISIEDGRLRFRHPLVRAAYGAASGPDRRAAHAALATALDDVAFADERAWHVALAAAGPDEEAAATIEAAGRRAEGRSRRAALRALVRAAALTPDGERRPQRCLAAARAATEAGAWDEAAALLDGSEASAPTGELAREHLYLRAVVAGKRNGDPAAAELLERAAAQLALKDPERAAVAEMQAAEVWMEWVDYERALAAAERASALPFGRGGKTDLAVLLARGDIATWAARSVEKGLFLGLFVLTVSLLIRRFANRSAKPF